MPQPNFPVPPINDGAAAWIIQNTLDCMQDQNVKALTFFDSRMKAFNLSEHYIVFRGDSIIFKIQRKLCRFIFWNKFLRYNFSSKYFDYLVALIISCFKQKPDAVVVHSTKWSWVLLIRRIIPFRATKVVWYHHNSEDQNYSPDVLEQYKEIDAHIFVSQYSREAFVSALESLDPDIQKKAFVVANGININLFIPDAIRAVYYKKGAGIDHHKIVICFIGRLIERKGFHHLFTALKNLPEALQEKITLMVVGAVDYYSDAVTTYTKNMQDLINLHDYLFDVKITGYIPHRQMPDVINASDIIVCPSLDLEGMPLTILEAQSTAKPVISSKLGGIPEIIDHELDGFLLEPPGDIQQIRDYVSRLITDKELAFQIGTKARIKITENYSQFKMAALFKKTIDQILQ